MDMEKKDRGAAVIVLAALFKAAGIVGKSVAGDTPSCFDQAEEFVKEAERRGLGKFK